MTTGVAQNEAFSFVCSLTPVVNKVNNNGCNSLRCWGLTIGNVRHALMPFKGAKYPYFTAKRVQSFVQVNLDKRTNNLNNSFFLWMFISTILNLTIQFYSLLYIQWNFSARIKKIFTIRYITLYVKVSLYVLPSFGRTAFLHLNGRTHLSRP